MIKDYFKLCHNVLRLELEFYKKHMLGIGLTYAAGLVVFLWGTRN